MNAALLLALIDGAISLIERLSPYVTDLFKSGDVTVEQQQALRDRIAALSASDAFSGPEWQVDAKPTEPPTA